MTTPWDTQDAPCLNGYALWTHPTTPFLRAPLGVTVTATCPRREATCATSEAQGASVSVAGVPSASIFV